MVVCTCFCISLCLLFVIWHCLQVQGDALPTTLVFSCDGVFSPFTDPVAVTTTVSAVEIVKLPLQLPFPSGMCLRMHVCEFKCVYVCVHNVSFAFAASTVSTLDGNAPLVVLRVVDSSGRGISGSFLLLLSSSQLHGCN
jgi:hypothetical protein